MHIFHKWSKWKEFTRNYHYMYRDKVVSSDIVKRFQRRTCEFCGKIQETSI